jgi:hypothetical protein
VFAATLAFLLWGTPAFAGNAPDSDGDGIVDALDNCSDVVNAGQDDTDLDDCGNVCDPDYTQAGKAGIEDFGEFVAAYGGNDERFCSIEPIPGCTVGLNEFGWFVANFGVVPGPSGPTAGTTACP